MSSCRMLTQDIIDDIAKMIEESLPKLWYVTSEHITPGQVMIIPGSDKFAMPKCYVIHQDDFDKVAEQAKGHVRLVHIREFAGSQEELEALARLTLMTSETKSIS